jgi:hypothetical protein
MKETAIEKRGPAPLKEKAQYALAFGVIALMLYVAGFPLFLLFFVGVLTFFIWKVFSSERRNETRRIFEFYLSANEILRDDDRRWYGFEIQDAVARGEAIVSSMSTAPPLVHFALGALYQKLDDHASAIKYLSAVEETSDERTIIFPSKELRDYVRVLRKIERAPAEAPLTSAAIRSLERARKHRAGELLQSSRAQAADSSLQLEEAETAHKYRAKARSVIDATRDDDDGDQTNVRSVEDIEINLREDAKGKTVKRRDTNSSPANRKTISEVLHDIYDTKIN